MISTKYSVGICCSTDHYSAAVLLTAAYLCLLSCAATMRVLQWLHRKTDSPPPLHASPLPLQVQLQADGKPAGAVDSSLVRCWDVVLAELVRQLVPLGVERAVLLDQLRERCVASLNWCVRVGSCMAR